MAYICAPAFVIVDGFRDSKPVASIAPSIEAKTIFWLLITLLNINGIYLTLGGTLSNVIIRNHYELLTIRRIENDVKVYSEIPEVQ